jgi:hypothetical protein
MGLPKGTSTWEHWSPKCSPAFLLLLMQEARAVAKRPFIVFNARVPIIKVRAAGRRKGLCLQSAYGLDTGLVTGQVLLHLSAAHRLLKARPLHGCLPAVAQAAMQL